MPNKYHGVFGWTDYHDIYEEAVKKYDNAAFAEIGSFQGKSAVMMGCDMLWSLGKKMGGIWTYGESDPKVRSGGVTKLPR